jgi:HlyD family secretion protein
MKQTIPAALAALLLLGGCRDEAPPQLYEAVPVARRDITVAAEAAGSVEPILVVDVKSRASGTILSMRAETGDVVRLGDTLVLVDRRDPTNTLNQASADLEVARAQLTNAESQKRRVDQMFQSQLVSEQEYEQANLTYANARAQLVRAETAVQTARDALDDTSVRAPISGVIIAKNVEVGNVIASATRDVTGGVVLLRMADLSEVQVRTLVDETDIGKIQPGMRAQIVVDAYPNRPFTGTVLKIEPQSTTNQNVTMFPVLIRIGNEQGLLRPGMNAEVEIQVAQRTSVIAIPNAALRTQRDVSSAAQVLGLDPEAVQQVLASADSVAGTQPPRGSQARTSTLGGSARTAASAARSELRAEPVPMTPAPTAAAPDTPAAAPTAAPRGLGSPGGGTTAALPPGVTQAQAMAVFAKRRNGEPLTAEDSTLLRRIREFRQQQGATPAAPAAAPSAQAATAAPGGQGGGMASMLPAGVTEERARSIMQRGFTGGQLSAEERAIFSQVRSRFQQASSGSQRRRFGSGNSFQFGGNYIVFVLRDGQPAPVRVRTGVTDLDYSEVVSGLTEQDTILLLPSASLVQSQQEMRDRFQRMTGGGAVPGMRQQTTTTTPPRTSTPAAPRGG